MPDASLMRAYQRAQQTRGKLQKKQLEKLSKDSFEQRTARNQHASQKSLHQSSPINEKTSI